VDNGNSFGYAKHQTVVLKFGELYNAALFRKLAAVALSPSDGAPPKR
jgi:hypothetical protein